MDYKSIITVLVLMCAGCTATGQQRQLVILKNENVLARYQPGDVLHFFREGDKEVQIQRILDLNDTLIMMNFDTVACYRIKKLDIRKKKGSTFSQRLGAHMIAAGVMLPLAELINTGLVQQRGASISPGVGIASGVLAGTGTVLLLIKKPYFKPGRKKRVFIVDKRSPFYKAQPGYSSPYIP